MPTKKKLKIVSISSELSPFSKSGGLSDVAKSLPEALKKAGADPICITPLYGQIIDKKKFGLKMIMENIRVNINSEDAVHVNYWQGELDGNVPVYFVESGKYFSKRKSLYGSTHENARFMVFCVASLKLLSLLKFKADIIHCHDWQTGLIPYYLKTDFQYSKTLKKAKTIYTIHNLVFQMGKNWWEVEPEKKDDGRGRLPHLEDEGIEYINFAKRAILSADAISTVSETYREEIMTKDFGQDLHRILSNRSDRLFGIVNGIDYEAWNPINDPGLNKRYNAGNFEGKQENKKYLQQKFSLTVNEKIPMVCSTSRMTFQKGFDLIVKILDKLMSMMNVQIVLAGSCNVKEYLSAFKKMKKKYPKKFIAMTTHEENQKYETLCYAASDFFILPSNYEPCGINQMIAMRYGCVPIVRKVGGLNDTVVNYSPATGKGTGFVFSHFDEFHLFGAIIRALENFNGDKRKWKELIKRIMTEANDWSIPAEKYIK
ncbi:glycosyltransferase, partial [Candidatus Falkowbacteria bacterium]|nr:glycosyltransferase [Candidatus Falkowbacteria bacterium]